MNSTTLALSSAGGASPTCSPPNRCTVAASPALSAYTTTPLTFSRCSYSIASASIMTTASGRSRSISCEVAVRSTNSTLSSSSSTALEDEEDEEQQRAEKKIGAKVRVKVPLKVYHVPRVPELDLSGKEGQLKQYVGLWKGKRISANFPYKIQFEVDIEGRGPVKFFSHLKEDEFEYLD